MYASRDAAAADAFRARESRAADLARPLEQRAAAGADAGAGAAAAGSAQRCGHGSSHCRAISLARECWRSDAGAVRQGATQAGSQAGCYLGVV